MKFLRHFLIVTVLLSGPAVMLAQKLPSPKPVWSVGPLTKGESVMSVAFDAKGATFSGPRLDSQTGSTFSATRSIAFAGDRVVLASKIGTRKVEGTQIPATVYQILSLDAQTGTVKDRREILAFASLQLFATNDAHVIVSGRSVMRLTPNLKDAGIFDYHDRGHKSGNVENISPDGSTLGNATGPGFELIDSHTLSARMLTEQPIVITSVSSKAVVSDSPWWTKDYPEAKSFVTLTDEKGQHLIFHGDCGGRPVFLSDNRILASACKIARILDVQGQVLREITLTDPVSFAGVSQNGTRFALQLVTYSGDHSINREHFAIFSVEGDSIAEVDSPLVPEAQSWTAFSPDGSLFVVGSPQKLTLYRLP